MKGFLDIYGNVGRKRVLESKSFYKRDDPDSLEAYYDVENGPDLDVECDAVSERDVTSFSWRRAKSNENVEYHGFSFYLARWLYLDNKRVVSGQKTLRDIAVVVTDEGNEGLLCSLDLSLFDGYDYDEDVSAAELANRVLVVVRQEETDDGHVRIVSCYHTKKLEYVTAYVNSWFSKKKYGTKRPDRLDKKDVIDNAKRLYELKAFQDDGTTGLTVEKIYEDYEKALVENYDAFVGIVRTRTPLKTTLLG